MDTRRYALITGASSGIGAAIAREYAARGKPTLLVARRADRLEALAAELCAHAPSVALAADLSDPAAPLHLFETLRNRGLAVDTLVNNAGYGVPGRYLSADWRVHADFLQVMQTAVAELTWRFLPAMEAFGHGRILNVASLAGLAPSSAGHTLYGVTARCPGFSSSEFHDVNGMREKVSRLPKYLWLDAQAVARIGVDAVEAGRLRVVTGTPNRIIAALLKYLPDGLARALVAGRSRDFRDGG